MTYSLLISFLQVLAGRIKKALVGRIWPPRAILCQHLDKNQNPRTGEAAAVTNTSRQLDSHLRVDLRGDEDAVVPGDGEFVVQDPAGRAGPRLATAVGGEGMQVSHVAVSQQEVVARAVDVVGHLGGKNVT